MNQPQGNGKDRWLKWGFVILVAMNLALMASIWLPQLKRAPVEKRGMGGKEHDLALQFLEETLKLSPEQKGSMEKLRAEHFLKADALRKGINLLRRQIMDEVLASAADKEKVERLAKELGEKQGSLEKLTFYHFLNLYNLCQPGQKEKFRSLMAELLDRLKPPPPDSPQRPSRAGRQAPQATNPWPSDYGKGPIGEPRPSAERAQEREQPRDRREEPRDEASRVATQVERLRQQLDLSVEQVEKLRPVLERFAGQIDQQRAAAQGDTDGQRQGEKVLKDQRDNAIEALLTDEQKTLFARLKEERRGQNPPARPPREN
jgi:Spy/CpxP family protein refolding chaperone